MDVWKIPKPIYTCDWTKSFQDFPINSDIAGVANLFVKNNSWRNSKKRYRFKLSSKDSINSDFVQFIKPPKSVPHKKHRGLIAVVCKLDGFSLDIGISGITPTQLKGTLNVPSIQSANEGGSSLQHFHCLNETDHDILCSTYRDGLLLEEGRDIAEQIDSVIQQYSSTTFTLVSLEKVIPVKEIESGQYHHFLRQFGGDASPNVDDSFHMIDEIPGLQVSYKMADAQDYISYPPLSVGFFNHLHILFRFSNFLSACLTRDLGELEHMVAVDL